MVDLSSNIIKDKKIKEIIKNEIRLLDRERKFTMKLLTPLEFLW
jgi:hypothetical protein